MATTTTYGALSASDHSAQLRKAVIASTIGTAIEWYDFFLYGTAAGLIFGKLFFPGSDPLTATLLSFGTYFIGFVGRPIGAAIFGHYGDRIGRKATLIATLLCMGIATFLIAFVPTYASIGIWGAVILTVLRMIQGIGVGGEWGGSVLLAMEWSRTHGQRGLVASWPQFGVPCGLFLANLAVLAFSQLSGDQFPPGAGVFRSCSRLFSLVSDYGFVLASLRRQYSSSSSIQRKSRRPPSSKSSSNIQRRYSFRHFCDFPSKRRSISSPHSSSLTPSALCICRAISS